jgi:hypothetical protein
MGRVVKRLGRQRNEVIEMGSGGESEKQLTHTIIIYFVIARMTNVRHYASGTLQTFSAPNY